jgi:hypothetical protein
MGSVIPLTTTALDNNGRTLLLQKKAMIAVTSRRDLDRVVVVVAAIVQMAYARHRRVAARPRTAVFSGPPVDPPLD